MLLMPFAFALAADAAMIRRRHAATALLPLFRRHY